MPAHPQDVVALVAQQLHSVRPLASRFASTMARWAANVEEVSAYEFRLKIRAGLDAGNWRRHGEELFEACANEPKPVLIVLDELPIFLLSLLRLERGQIQVDEFLNWLRAVQQNVAGRGLTFIASGSIGLVPLTSRLGLPDRINHLHTFRLQPWTHDTSAECLARLAASHGLTVEPGVTDAVVEKLGIGIPHHVQSFFAHLREDAMIHDRSELRLEAVGRVYHESLLAPWGQIDLMHYDTRLRDAFDERSHRIALEILTEAATQGVLTDTARDRFEAHLAALGDEAQGRIAGVLDVLVHDGYLIPHDDGHVFQSRLLRDWWIRPVRTRARAVRRARPSHGGGRTMTPPGRTVRKFNPGTGQTDDEVINQFVVRDNELEILLDVLRSNIDAACCQSTLVVAPRGAGKTMLLARTAAELRSNPDYSQHLLPVRFMEESHEAYDIGEFWLEALFHLILEIESTAPDLARELRRSREDLSARWRTDLAAQAFGALLDAADRVNRRLVLLVENLQNLCRDTDAEFGWSLRAVLQNEPRIMLLGSATTRFQELRNAKEPFFELFHIVHLKPLDSAACLRLWHTVSGNGTADRTIRPLEIFTGGSPRLLVIVAEFARHRSLPRLMEELVTLIDNHTEYFRGHLEQLPRGERRVYVAIIDLWQPSGAGEIAQRARMDIRPASTCIGRLLARGLISAQGTGRRKRYVATERLYSIYYKLRRERDEAAVVRNLIRFMVAFYTPDDLMGMSDDLVHGASESVAIYQGIARALRDEPTFVDVFERSFVASVAKELEEGRHEQALRSCERLLTGEPLPPTTTCKVLAIKANCLDEAGDHPAELAAYNELIERFGHDQDADVQELVTNAEINRGATLNELGDTAAAIDACDRVIHRLRPPENTAAEARLAMALANKATALRVDEQFPALIDTLDEIVARFGDRDEDHFKIATIGSLINKGTVLDLTDDTAGAVATYDAVWHYYGDCGLPEVQVPLAGILFNRAVGLRKMNDHLGAIEAYKALDRRFGDASDPEIQYWVAQGLINLGVVLSRDVDDSPRAIRTYNHVVDRFAETHVPRIRRQVAIALLNRGCCATTYRRPRVCHRLMG